MAADMINADGFLAQQAQLGEASSTPSTTSTSNINKHATINGSILEAGVHLSGTLPDSVPAKNSTANSLKQNLSYDHLHEEYQYLNLTRDVLSHGEYRPDRTGTGTLSVFSPSALRFTLSKPDPVDPTKHINILPLLTTKRVFFRAVLAELLWFLRGSTDSTLLSSQNVHIWDGNGSRAYLDSLGPPQSLRPEGDLGPVYGFQWRHFGAEYETCHTDYRGKGVDQLAQVIRSLKEKPYDRRIILSAWNVKDIPSMALPPCHIFAQFYVSYDESDAPRGAEAYMAWRRAQAEHASGTTNGSQGQKTREAKLSCHLYQRSADIGLGVPFNIASYALLTQMLAFACGLIPGEFIHTLGDAHVYVDHIEALTEQIQRQPRDFPTVRIESVRPGDDSWGAALECVDNMKYEDFIVDGYKPYAGIKMKMSV